MKKIYLFIIFAIIFIYPLTVFGIDKNSIQDELNFFKGTVQSSLKKNPTVNKTNSNPVTNNIINNPNNNTKADNILPDHGLLFTDFVFTNSGNLDLTPAADKAFNEIQKSSDETLKKNLNSDDYVLRLFSFIWLNWKFQNDNYTITYSTDTKWKENIRPLVIDLYYAINTDRNIYIDFETESVLAIFKKLDKTSFPELKSILLNQNENIKLRKTVVFLFWLIFREDTEAIKILQQSINNEPDKSEMNAYISHFYKTLIKNK